MTHGWPSGIAEFIDVVDELADPKDADAPAFHVVIPSLPGFGYSDKPATTEVGNRKIAAAWVELMGRLGYSKFAAHGGGDWGSVITTVLAGRFPAHVLGIHTVLAQAPPGLTTRADGGRAQVDRGKPAISGAHAAYAKQQATRPQTIGHSLVDSPVGETAPGSLTSSPSGRSAKIAVRDDFQRRCS